MDTITASYTGSAALSKSLAPQGNFELLEFTVCLSAIPTTSELFTVMKNIAEGAAFDAAVYTKDFSTLTSGLPASICISYAPGEITFKAGDTLDFAYANTDAVTYGLQVKYRRVS